MCCNLSVEILMHNKINLGERHLNWVFHNKKFIFTMIKKCGTITIQRVLFESMGLDPNVNLKRYGELINIVSLHDTDALDYTKVAWVRNPFDRLVSGWWDRIHTARPEYTKKMWQLPNTISFPDFIDWVCSYNDDHMNAHFKQQTHEITIDGRLVPNRIMKMENLKTEWSQLQIEHPWLPNIKWHDHKSDKGDYRKYYTGSIIDKVMIRFKNDLNLLEYGGIDG